MFDILQDILLLSFPPLRQEMPVCPLRDKLTSWYFTHITEQGKWKVCMFECIGISDKYSFCDLVWNPHYEKHGIPDILFLSVRAWVTTGPFPLSGTSRCSGRSRQFCNTKRILDAYFQHSDWKQWFSIKTTAPVLWYGHICVFLFGPNNITFPLISVLLY